MKKLIYFLILLSATSFAQQGPKWSTDGNSISTDDFLGTTNNFPLDFKINNALKMKLDINGNLNINNLAGTGSRVLMTDLNGKIISLPAGIPGQFLQGDGTWASLPGGATSWQLIGSNLISTNTGNIGIGTNNPLYKLSVVGNANITGNLLVGGGVITTNSLNTTVKINAGDVDVTNNLNVSGTASVSGSFTAAGAINFSALGGGAVFRPLYVTPTGNVVNSFISAPGWIDPSLGGNACNPYSSPWLIGGNTILGTGFNDITVGTCDNYDFILKSNGINKQWIKANGKIGFGTANPIQAFHFTGGSILLDNNSPTGNIIKLRVQGAAHNMGLCVETDHPGDFEYNTKLIVNNNTTKALAVINSLIGGNEAFVVRGNGMTSVGYQTGAPNSAQLNINVNGGNAFNIFDQTTNQINFSVKANGTVYSREVWVQSTPFPDYVFNKEYKLQSITDRKKFILANKHLPNMPTAKEVEKNGANVGEIQKVTVEKLEEAYLYIFQLDEKFESLTEKYTALNEKFEMLNKKFEAIKNK